MAASALCDYNKCIAALDFHHRDPSTKSFGINDAINQGRSWIVIQKEATKCDLICCRCHREIEYQQPEVDISSLFKKFMKVKHVDTLLNKEGVPTPSELKTLVRNHSLAEIGRAYDVTGQTVKYWCEKFNVKIAKVIVNRSERIPYKEELQRLIKEKTAVQIGVQFRVTDKAVRKWLVKYGIKNPRSEKFYKATKIAWTA